MEEVFARMLARKLGTAADARAIGAEVGELCESLVQGLRPLIGDNGVDAIFARALSQAERRFPWLAPVTAADSSDGRVSRVQKCLEEQEASLAGQAGIVVLSSTIELLAWLIGEGITIRLLSDIWPDDFGVDMTEEPNP